MNDSGDAGWYPDPSRRFEFRYFNGQRWTNDVSVQGQRLVDSGEGMSPGPLGAAVPRSPTLASSFDSPGSLATPGRGLAIASFVLATSAALIGWVPYVFALAIAAVVAAIVFGIIGLRRAKVGDGAGRGFATAGLIISAVALCSCIGGLFFTVWVRHQIDRYDHPGRNTVKEGSCTTTDGVVTFAGTITNGESDTRSYELTLTFTSEAQNVRLQYLDVRSVPAGATVPWTTTQTLAAQQGRCAVDGVHGPAPFGVRRG